MIWSLITMAMLWLKNNSVYNDLIIREMAKSSNSEDVTENGTCAKIITFFKDLLWKIRLHGRFTLAPIIKTTPNLLFKVFAYTLILIYSSDWYSGIGLFFPLGLFATMTLLSFAVGRLTLPIKDEELLVNSFSGVVLPIYINVFDVVSSCIHLIWLIF